jgi:hypothetical protein
MVMREERGRKREKGERNEDIKKTAEMHRVKKWQK